MSVPIGHSHVFVALHHAIVAQRVVRSPGVDEDADAARRQLLARISHHQIIAPKRFCSLQNAYPGSGDRKSHADVVAHHPPTSLEGDPRRRCVDALQRCSIKNVFLDHSPAGVLLHINVFRGNPRAKVVAGDDIVVAVVLRVAAVCRSTPSCADVDCLSVADVSQASFLYMIVLASGIGWSTSERRRATESDGERSMHT